MFRPVIWENPKGVADYSKYIREPNPVVDEMSEKIKKIKEFSEMMKLAKAYERTLAEKEILEGRIKF